MIKSLYDTFQRWSYDGSVYIISDLHFADNDCKLMDPGWPDPDKQVDLINSVAHKADTLICLGDVGDVSYVAKLKAGYKVLITGNHDAGASKYQKVEDCFDVSRLPDKEIAKLKDKGYRIVKSPYLDCAYRTNNLFDEVFTGPLFISDKILLSHEPIGLPFALNIHGHDHNNMEEYKDDCRYLNVAANVIGYKPISLDQVIRSGILKGVPTLHRMTIDRASNKKPE